MDGVCRRWTKMDEDRQRWPKFLTARCVMLANITASGRPASGFLTRLRLDDTKMARIAWAILTRGEVFRNEALPA